jgi:ribosomal protein S18 acetylase RimI-like enzyme
MTSPAPVPGGAVSVRAMTEQDRRWAAALHARCLPHGFFASLGPRFLDAYYGSFLGSPYAVALVAESPAAPESPPVEAGVLVGTTANAAHYRHVLRSAGPRLALAGALALLGRPRQLAVFLRFRAGRYLNALRRFRRRPAPASTPRQQRPRGRRGAPVSVLTHVSVAEFARGSGAGKALVQTFLDAARDAGAAETQLVTLAGPEGAGGFYERLGWTRTGEHPDHDGRPVETWTRRLS